jgi:hypothetical protein
MVAQPGIVEAFLSQLENLNGVMETGIVPMYGTDREVNLRYFLI